MDNWLDRSRLLIKDDGLEKLGNAGVLVVGLGGVGGFAAEFLAGAGVGRMTIVDGDCVGITNINRQIAALNSTVGMPKADVMAARIKDIKPGNRFADGPPLSMPGRCPRCGFSDDLRLRGGLHKTV